MEHANVFGSVPPVAQSPLDIRLAFLRRTYAHLAGTVGLFVALSWFLVTSGLAESLMGLYSSPLLFVGAFMVAGWLASRMAHAASVGVQYAGLVLYAGFYAVFFAPLLWYAATAPAYAGVLPQATGLTLLTFGGLTAFVFMTKKDFSFLGPILMVAGIVALGCILCSFFFGLNLGVWFAGGMILFACAAILYDTSKILLHYHEGQHVGAAVELFASVMLLFWYILNLLMQLRR